MDKIGPRSVESGFAWALFAGALATGIFARISGLGWSPLAGDEYYFISSVENVLEHGLPQLPGGGYYDRGLAVQYLTAGAVQLFGSNGFAFRLPATVFGFLSVLLTYVYARLFCGRPLSLVIAACLLLSSWHVEFSRFARMYTAFACTTLLFLIAAHHAYVRDRWKLRYVPHAVLLLGIFAHHLNILLVPMVLLPFVPSAARQLRPLSDRVRYAAGCALTAAAVLGPWALGLRNYGADDRLPLDYAGAHSSSFRLPGLPLWSPTENVSIAVFGSWLLVGVVALGFVLQKRLRGGSVAGSIPDLLLWAIVLASALHQLALAGLLSFVLLVRYPDTLFDLKKAVPRLLVSAALAAAWLAYAWLNPAWMENVSPGDPARALRVLLFGFPDFFAPIVSVWRDELPRLGLLFAGAIGFLLYRHGRDELRSLLLSPYMTCAYVLTCISLLNAPGLTSRYFFFIYPVLLVTLGLAVATICQDWVPRQPKLAALLLALGLFVWSDDFNPGHLMSVSSPEVRFRTGEWASFAPTWFWRYDFEGPGRYLGEHAPDRPGVRLLNINQAPLSYYYRREHAVYTPREVGRYSAISRKRGTLDLWSSQRLLSRTEDLQEYTHCADEVWLVRHHNPAKAGWPFFTDPVVGGFYEDQVWGDRFLGSESRFRGRDGRLEVRVVTLSPPSGGDCS